MQGEYQLFEREKGNREYRGNHRGDDSAVDCTKFHHTWDNKEVLVHWHCFKQISIRFETSISETFNRHHWNTESVKVFFSCSIKGRLNTSTIEKEMFPITACGLPSALGYHLLFKHGCQYFQINKWYYSPPRDLSVGLQTLASIFCQKRCFTFNLFPLLLR